ncbi:MAG: AAA family ATPase, partial [Actinomycetaceae bacterium]|nr:AAA family ATPase [Actinomycetaceae bacterium]
MSSNEKQKSTTKDNEKRSWNVENSRSFTDNKDEKKNKKFWKFFVPTFIIVIIVSFFGTKMWMDHADPVIEDLPYDVFYEQVQAGNIKELSPKSDTIEGELKEKKDYEGITYSKFITERPSWMDDDLDKLVTDNKVKITAKSPTEPNYLYAFITSVFPIILFIAIFIWFFSRKGGLFGFSEHKAFNPENGKVTFEDVAGIDEVEEQLREIVDMIKNPETYTRLGARTPKGLLLEGAPGTGKTLLARATAGEADIPFFTVSAASIGGVIAGKGVNDIKSLFEAARKEAPSLIFIDEIDAIGRSRAHATSIASNDDREQTLNQILTEMDGFDSHEQVVVIAATNLADVLDPALTRAGRFDRTITVHAPDQKGREAIFNVHLKDHPLADDVNVTALAKSTPGLTGADIENLVNEASLEAARKKQENITMADFSNALEMVHLGVERKVVMSQEDRERTAWHEGGHALLGMIQPGADPVRKISIIPRGQ